MTSASLQRVWEGLAAVEAAGGDELRKAAGQGIDRIIRDDDQSLVSESELAKRALALAWVASPNSFGGRSIREILASVK